MLHPVWQSIPVASSPAESGSDHHQVRQEDRKVGITLHLVETKPIDGLTTKDGLQKSCDPDDLVYPHVFPFMVLNSELATVQTKEFEFDTGSGPKPYYMVTLELSEKARQMMAQGIEGNEMHLLTAMVDGNYRSVQRYEKDSGDKYVPESARADSFSFNLGMFLSLKKVDRIKAMLD